MDGLHLAASYLKLNRSFDDITDDWTRMTMKSSHLARLKK
jgi:hypothetical protein